MTVISYHINVILDVNNAIEELIDKRQKVGKNVGRRKKVRLEQIAEAVGSSVVTVSNALNDRKGVSEELRSRIKET